MDSSSQRPDLLLQTHPRWRPEDLGEPLPASLHATSVCLPQWKDVIGYEEKHPRVMQKLQAGYPRFVVPPACFRYFADCRRRFARDGENCHAYPSERAALRCAHWIKQWSGVDARIHHARDHGIFIVIYPIAAETWALKYWRHTGEGISSRRADALLRGAQERDGAAAKQIIRDRVAGHAGANAEDVFLFKSGMAAIYTAFRAAARLQPAREVVQFGFPYVDTLKILQDFGSPHRFMPFGNAEEISELNGHLSRTPIAGLFCEFPSNPLLKTPDLHALSALARSHRFPLIVDDTISSWANVDLLSSATAVVTSLTKSFTGRGDVMAGSIVLNANDPLYQDYRAALESEYEDALWGDNLIVIEDASRDFIQRSLQAGRTAGQVCEFLRNHPAVAEVHYPQFGHRAGYDAFRRKDGTYGSLFSVLLKDAAALTPNVFDRLEYCKGPNLGTTFSLCCPFTMLAHYGELDWAERCGVSRNLLRISIGLEPANELIARLQRALP